MPNKMFHEVKEKIIISSDYDKLCICAKIQNETHENIIFNIFDLCRTILINDIYTLYMVHLPFQFST